jgi:hypothetical protein
MLPIDGCSLKKSLPILIGLFVVAQIDLASAAGWPGALLSLLHLTPAPVGGCKGLCAGLGASLDVIVVFQFARIWARRALHSGDEAQHD